MFKNVLTAFRVKDIRNKILFTLFMLIIIRIGSNIPVPGVNTDFFKNLFDGLQAQDAVGWLSNMTGGSFEQMSIFALSITPYITSSIIMELLTIAIPALEEIQKEGDEGRRKIAEYTRYVTVILALLESSAMAIGFSGSGFFKESPAGVFTIIVAIFAMTAGSAFLMWTGERITEHGVGNGISVVLLFNIISSLPRDFNVLYETFIKTQSVSAYKIMYALIIVAAFIGLIALSVILQDARRDIPVQYASRIAGRTSVSNGASVIPLKVNTSGVIPVIFASSVMSLPLIVLQFMDVPRTNPMYYVASFLNSGSWFNPDLPIYYSLGALVYVFLVIFFAYFYTSITFNPTLVANNLKKSGGFIPGIRAGKETADYLNRILNYIIFIGAVMLCVVALIPIVASGVFNISRISFAGTSLLIVVGVILETLTSIESQLVVRNYKGFLS